MHATCSAARCATAVRYSAYLFYKWAGHPGQADDAWGAALDPAGIVAQARRMVDEYGFTAIKLKGGVFPPDEEIAAIKALRAAFPDHPLRLDPNAAWTVQTSIEVAPELERRAGVPGGPDRRHRRHGRGRAARRRCRWPPTCAWSPSTTCRRPSRQDAVQVVLSDHHYWGGLRRSQTLAAHLRNLRASGLSMHSNSHLGISLAAMTHLAAATPNLDYACDTHWPWKDRRTSSCPARCRFADGAVAVPTAPGPRRRARPRRARPAARAVPRVRAPRPRRHRLHAADRSDLRGDEPRW